MLKFLLSPWIFYFLMILGTVLAIVLISKATKLFITSRTWEKYRDNSSFVYDLLCAEFPNACILKDVPVSSTGTKGVQITQSIDILYVSRGGVLIISIVNGTGAFDNPKTGNWRYRYPDSNGKPITVNIPNPFDVTIPASNILEGLLAGEKIFLDVNRIAVFSGNKIGLTNKYAEAVHIDDLTSYIQSFDQHSILNGPQFRSAATAVTAFAQYNQYKNISAKHNLKTESISSKSKNDTDAEITDTLDQIKISDNVSSENDEAAMLLREIQNEIDKETNSKDDN